jgi:flavin reductase
MQWDSGSRRRKTAVICDYDSRNRLYATPGDASLDAFWKKEQACVATTAMPLSTSEFRRALGHFATGVTVVTVARDDGQIHGMTANSFSSVSLEPLQILVCVDRLALTHKFLHERRAFGINILAEDHEAIARYFARTDQDPEAATRIGIKFESSERGTPLLSDTLVQLDCDLVSAIESGDHSIFIGQVVEMRLREGQPLLFHGGQFKKFGTPV